MNRSKKNISSLKDCYGCGVCVAVCPVKIISLRENANGFYAPVIDDEEKCINCGLCLKVCAFNHDNVCKSNDRQPEQAYAAWSRDENVREWCSSGGVGFEVGRHLIEQGRHALGVRYDADSHRARLYGAETVSEFMASVGSKYIPAYTADALTDLDFDKKYLVTGTPCQIDSMRRLLQIKGKEDNFVLLDFFCHGVPSLLMWDKYIAAVEGEIGKTTFVSWRNKSAGWQDSYAVSADTSMPDDTQNIDLTRREPEHKYSSRLSRGDLFFDFFLGNYCLNRCCYKSCKYKMLNSAADIRIGDLWGKRYVKSSAGVSAVLAMTAKGRRVLDEMGGKVDLHCEATEVVTEGQMRRCVRMPWAYNSIMRALRSDARLSRIKETVIWRYRLTLLPQRVWNRIKGYLK